MPSTPLNLGVILGSVRQGRFGPVVARWFIEQAERDDRFKVDLIDLADHPLPLAMPTELPAVTVVPRPAEMADLTRRIEASDAIVVVTPEYNRSFPASLKCAIDWHYTEWRAKPIGFVSYSGGSGGILAVEQLRQVFTELRAVTIRDGVAFPRYYELFGPDGTLKDPTGPDAAAEALLGELAWWGALLRNARRGGESSSAA